MRFSRDTITTINKMVSNGEVDDTQHGTIAYIWRMLKVCSSIGFLRGGINKKFYKDKEDIIEVEIKRVR